MPRKKYKKKSIHSILNSSAGGEQADRGGIDGRGKDRGCSKLGNIKEGEIWYDFSGTVALCSCDWKRRVLRSGRVSSVRAVFLATPTSLIFESLNEGILF